MATVARWLALGSLVWIAMMGSAAAETPKRGGILNFAVVAEPPNYDCHANTTFAFTHPVIPHYSMLLKFDGPTYPAIVGDLAERWEASADGLAYTFHLVKGARFHDGSPLTSEDVRASYERLRNPPEGVLSVRKVYFRDVTTIETPDAYTVVFRLKTPNASMLDTFASPFGCIYKAAKLKENPRYPETEILGSGPFVFVNHVRGATWEAKRFDQYHRPGRPYLDGYKIFFVKSGTVVAGMMGGQFDAEFRGRSPPERQQLVDRMGDRITIYEGKWTNSTSLTINTARKPFDDVRVRQALSLAIDRWGASAALGKISLIRNVGGSIHPGGPFALTDRELEQIPGFWRDIEKSRAEARRLLKEAGQETLSFKLFNRTVNDPYTVAGVFLIDQWKRIGLKVEHEQVETKHWYDRMVSGDFDAGIDNIAVFTEDPTPQLNKILTKASSPQSWSNHTDTKIDELFERQQRMLDVAARKAIVNEIDRYALTQAYSVPVLWYQRTVILNKKVKGWAMTTSHYLNQDLADVWLDQ